MRLSNDVRPLGTFRWSKALLKGLKGALLAGAAAAGMASSDGMTTLEDLVKAFAAGAVGFTFEAGRNWIKNR